MEPQDFRNPGAEYRGVTLWMLNDKLEVEEIVRQFDGIRAAGWGAVIGRTFNGLLTEYLSEEWMEIIEAIVGRAKKHDMRVWLQAGYMPSGIPNLDPADVGMGLAVRGKDEAGQAGDVVLAEDDRYAYCARSLGYVLDLLNRDAVMDYLDLAYIKPWYGRFGKEFGKTIEAIWVDEPHFRPPLLPWGDRVAETFRRQWGYDVAEHLPSLFRPVGDHQKVRHQYWRTVTGMFLDAYFEPVSRWCAEHDVKFSGHLMGEDTLNNQIGFTGACMPCYGHMHLPGIDHLTMSLRWPAKKKFILTPKQASSAAGQLGIPEVLCEMYGVSSQGITFEDRKEIAQWMAVLGINYRCYHATFYSLRGRRKRIYAPHLSYQQPWWGDNRLEADHFARLSYALRRGTTAADVLVIHSVESAMCLYDAMRMTRPHDRSTEAEDVKTMDDELVALCDNLQKIHRGWEFGDETLMAGHGRVEDGELRVGHMTYKAVILPAMLTLRQSTVDLLSQFAAAGGTILSSGERPTRIDGEPSSQLSDLLRCVSAVKNSPAGLRKALDAVIPPEVEIVATAGQAEDVWVHTRHTDEGRLYYFVNTNRRSGVDAEVRLRCTGQLQWWGLDSGDVMPAEQRRDGDLAVTTVSLAPLGSCLLVAEGKAPSAKVPRKTRKEVRSFDLSQLLSLKRHDPNAITLDICRMRKDGGAWGERLPVITVQKQLDDEQYHGPVTLEFRFNVASRPQSICLVIEDAANYGITVNGKAAAYAGLPYYLDRAFHPVDIAALVKEGENVVELTTRFDAIPRSKFDLASLFEKKEGTELESVYLIGDFAVTGPLSKEKQQPRCIRYAPQMAIDRESPTASGDLTAEGYPFFAGRVTLSDTVTLDRPAGDERLVLELPNLDATVLAKVRVNGREAGAILWPPYECDITDCVAAGENRIEIELVGSLRNLLGPHHRSQGEPDNCWRTAWDHSFDPGKVEHAEEGESTWTDDYFCLQFGFRGRVRVKTMA
ncbi:MAG: hypothetical protein JXL80_00925 [Planctomycetes bacterium]|nr:hypothetical protein [Planctomycetota bacterium]